MQRLERYEYLIALDRRFVHRQLTAGGSRSWQPRIHIEDGSVANASQRTVRVEVEVVEAKRTVRTTVVEGDETVAALDHGDVCAVDAEATYMALGELTNGAYTVLVVCHAA